MDFGQRDSGRWMKSSPEETQGMYNYHIADIVPTVLYVDVSMYSTHFPREIEAK
jgi:hypothetical protein